MSNIKKIFAGVSLILCPMITPPLTEAKCTPVHRSSAVLRHFQYYNPCPSTHSMYGPCPGYIKDHIIPLCLTGKAGDNIHNIQWQTVAEAKEKDHKERIQCQIVGCQHRGD